MDVKDQVHDRISDLKDSAEHKKEEFVSKAKQVAPDSPPPGVQQVATTVKRRPAPFTVAGVLAIAVLIGWLLSRQRDSKD
jgi:hypothetical protein